ncbi:MAG: low molecular weight phosphotyrosine protein phosphatase [Aeromicrobium sp.]|uniref:low molecular weight protein-tyrosine-phosphatase n=1 Tax=Aeromicrobium sp. TaxID=1871063 RepID=UPI002604F6B6|nr:low molecular weight protein-tyrosine-phosphatase [Aeromicrobium sp.]MDF1705707.1 low molecular weight phosphotyrosine protein phosphatase [Aeromicrobium sp.]
MTQSEPYRVTFVCLGNICRSPTAHVVLEARLADAGLADRVTVTSSGTGGWHTGEPMDPRTASTLRGSGYDPTRHVARTFSIDDYAESDLILVMDHSNEADVLELAPSVEEQQKVRMFREFDPEADPDDLEVPDPWFGDSDGFTQVLAMVERTCDALVEHLRQAE